MVFDDQVPFPGTGVGVLTHRELQVLLLLVDGNTHKEVGRKLGISPRTVDVHREACKKKLKVKTLAGLVRASMGLGLKSMSSFERESPDGYEERCVPAWRPRMRQVRR
jgi:DNA-binding CsgD family transcriptional regulator